MLKEIEISNLVKAEWNYKKDDTDKSKKLLKSIKRNGFIENIIVRPIENDKFEVINGNHRLDVLSTLDYEKVPCIIIECDLKKAKRVAIETNETKFPTDNNKLSGLLNNLIDSFDVEDLAETLPFKDEELENIIGEVHIDFADNGIEKESTDSNNSNKEQFTEINYLFNNLGITKLSKDLALNLSKIIKFYISKLDEGESKYKCFEYLYLDLKGVVNE